MVKALCILHYGGGPHVHTVVEVTKEEHVGEVVRQVKLAQLFLFEVAHAFQNVVVVLVASACE